MALTFVARYVADAEKPDPQDGGTSLLFIEADNPVEALVQLRVFGEMMGDKSGVSNIAHMVHALTESTLN